MGELTGRRALVTGAGRGLGRAIAVALADAGADLGVTARTEADLSSLAEEIGGMGRRCVWAVCDVTDLAQVREMAASLTEGLGGLEILVNNAGSAGSHKFLDHPDELWHKMLAANLSSVYYVTKACLPALIGAGGGRIVNIASTAARAGSAYTAAYTAAKHGVLGLTRVLAVELVRYGITVNAVCPGYLDTPLTEESIANIVARTGATEEAARASLEKTCPQGRLISPVEVAALVVYLARNEARGITGQAINVDGGGVQS
ncbi:MAG: SDR family NAD(P)-dependent oxidoreductase [Chloroflexia bacterium]